MSDEYTPTTDEIRDYVEVGGEPQPWLPPAPDKDAARVAAFDRWLADHDERVKAEAKAEALEEAAREWAADPAAWGDNDKDFRNELRDRAATIRQQLMDMALAAKHRAALHPVAETTNTPKEA